MKLKLPTNFGRWDAEIAWYSPSATARFSFNGFENDLTIHTIRPTWLCLIVKVSATRTKFLEPFVYSTVINCAFIFRLTNVFDCFHDITAQLKLEKHNFLNYTPLHIYLCGLQITTQSVDMHNVSANQPSRTTPPARGGTFYFSHNAVVL